MIIALLDELSFLADGRFEVKAHEEVVVANFLTKHCTKSLKASSLLSSDSLEWWNSPEGRAYVEENRKFIERDGEVIRVFILENDQIEDFKDTLYSHHKIG